MLKGTKVRWVSQAQGSAKEKFGVIVAVVPKGKYPHPYCPKGTRLPCSQRFSAPRGHRSFLVRIGERTVLNWPRVEYLTEV